MNFALKMRVRALAPAAFGLAALTSAAAWGQTGSKEKVVNVYTSRHYDVDKILHEKFTAATGIKVNEVQIKEAPQLIERLKSEGKNSPADVVTTVDIGNLWRAMDADLLQPVESKALADAVPENLRDPAGLWYATTIRARVLVYNKAKIKPEDIANYEDLTKDGLKGKVLVRSSNHVYNQSLTAALIQANGERKAEEWAAGVTKNLARKPEGGDTDQIKAVSEGKGDVAIVNSYYVARLMKSTKPEERKLMERVGVVFPNQANRGTHINVSGAGVVKFAVNKENAIKYIEFMVSPEAQALLAKENNEYPVRKDVAWDSVVKGLGSPKFDVTSLTVIGKNTPTAIKVMDRAGWR